MSIDIPRVQPIVTPTAAALPDELAVQKSARVDAVPVDLPRPRVERRVVPERRVSRERRPAGMDLRARADRRSGARIDVNA